MMSEMMDNMVVSDVANVGDVKCRTSEDDESAVGGFSGKLPDSDVAGADIEQNERKKKTRRRKAKRKNPYQKQMTETQGKKNMRLRDSKNVYEQPVAPYNSNQFLIDDHNDLQDFDVKLMAVANRMNGEQKGAELGPPRTGRVRDASFTSAESDEDFFYSSPEDEEEFLVKEFSNTYRDLHVETLANMSKTELIQTILQLEERVDSLQKRLDSEGDQESTTNEEGGGGGSGGGNGGGKSTPTEQTALFQTEISKLVLANQRLVTENARLRETGTGSGGGGRATSSSEDSESDSSSSSETTDDEEMPHETTVRVNGEIHKGPTQDNT